MNTELKTQIEAMQESMKQMRTDLTAKMRLAFTEGAKSLFETHPKLKSFGWTQYTPYFNDGEACEFSTNIDSEQLYINDTRVDDEDEDGKYPLLDETWEGGKYVPNPDYDIELGAALNDVLEFLQLFDEEYFQEAFDDHVKVTVSQDGVEVDGYDHD